MTARRLLACAVVLLLCALALLLLGCGADPLAAAHRTPSASPQHSAADLAFAQSMIPHHAQGAEMARLALDRAGSDAVTQLAERIRQDQEDEIGELYALLHAWDVPDTGPEGTAMPGATDGAQMRQLEELRGPAFDRQFLALMIAHHEGAVQMASEELTQGSNPEAKLLAGRVLDAQQAEASRMRGMLSG